MYKVFSKGNKRVNKKLIFTALISLGFTSQLFADKWDMPTPYGDGNHPTKVAMAFAKEVSEKAGDKLSITVHSGGSLIKHPEIKRAVNHVRYRLAKYLLAD